MKKILALVLSVASLSAFAQVDVNGYYRSNGTYVQPYHRTAPNNTISDNYSTKGNINPYTGQPGTVVDHQAEYQMQMARQQAEFQRQMQQQQLLQQQAMMQQQALIQQQQQQRQQQMQQMQLQQQQMLQMQQTQRQQAPAFGVPSVKPPCNPYIFGSC